LNAFGVGHHAFNIVNTRAFIISKFVAEYLLCNVMEHFFELGLDDACASTAIHYDEIE